MEQLSQSNSEKVIQIIESRFLCFDCKFLREDQNGKKVKMSSCWRVCLSMVKSGHRFPRLWDAELNPKSKTDTIPSPTDLKKLTEMPTLRNL